MHGLGIAGVWFRGDWGSPQESGFWRLARVILKPIELLMICKLFELRQGGSITGEGGGAWFRPHFWRMYGAKWRFSDVQMDVEFLSLSVWCNSVMYKCPLSFYLLAHWVSIFLSFLYFTPQFLSYLRLLLQKAGREDRNSLVPSML